MLWRKCGLIYQSPFDGTWKDNSALTPTPIMLNDETIRIYASFRDVHGIGRIGYVDLDASNPKIIKKVSDRPVLGIGRDGCFDDNGIILGDVIKIEDQFYMYYVGFQLVNKVKFLAFTGLAISSDGGETFVRNSQAPILDRTNTASYIRAIHTVMFDDNKFKAWCGVGDHWEFINDMPYPSYNIRCYESQDGIHFDNLDAVCIDLQAPEYRAGRPRVYKDDRGYRMIFTFGTIDGRYEMGYAESKDGLNWVRDDKKLGIKLSESGWDSKWISYGALIESQGKMYMFYNGNDMGRNGFGYAELMSLER